MTRMTTTINYRFPIDTDEAQFAAWKELADRSFERGDGALMISIPEYWTQEMVVEYMIDIHQLRNSYEFHAKSKSFKKEDLDRIMGEQS